jgi:hypothetical protein
MNRTPGACVLLVIALTAGCASKPTTPYNESYFKATHNSYSGGDRGSIVAQLDGGVRFIELDVHDDEFASHNDFRVGHNQPISEVDLTPPNPKVVFLRAWLQLIDDWSDKHPKHAPIVVSLDLKDDISDNPAEQGDIRFLNRQLRDVFGVKLYTATGHKGKWGATEALRGKIVVVLSGSRPTRQAYLSTTEPSWHDQVAFVEFQKGDDDALPGPGLHFFAALYSPANLAWAREWREKGKLVRLWRFNSPLSGDGARPPANYPATDAPFADEYTGYARRLNAVE